MIRLYEEATIEEQGKLSLCYEKNISQNNGCRKAFVIGCTEKILIGFGQATEVQFWLTSKPADICPAYIPAKGAFQSLIGLSCYFWVFPECRYFCLCLSITKRERRDGKKDARTSGKPALPRPSFFKLTLL